MLQQAPQIIQNTHVDTEEVDEFLDKVSEVSRLLTGLKAGTISPEYIDTKIAAAADRNKAPSSKVQPTEKCFKPREQDTLPDAVGRDEERQAELQRKLAELKANRERKSRLRQLYQEHTEKYKQCFATDYTKWDLFCPSDDEDDVFNSITPNNPQFKAMEKDIDDRHKRMVEQRQVAERQRQLGNEAYKAKQYGEALRCYESGLEVQKHNMALHANAAMAALKLKCYVQAMEHCDKVLHLADILHNNPKHLLCVKALQRRAAAYQALDQHGKAVADLKAAEELLPGDKEIVEQLHHAQAVWEEHKTIKKLKGMASVEAGDESACNGSTVAGVSFSTLQRIEHLATMLTAAQQGADMAEICFQLTDLIKQDHRHCLYLRQCGGLTAAMNQVVRPSNSAALAAALQLLVAACEHGTTLEQLALAQQLIVTALDQIQHANPDVSAAALELLYTISSKPAHQQELGKALLSKPAVINGQRASSRLEVLWHACVSANKGTALDQALTVSLLSNCMLAPSVRDASSKLLLQEPDLLELLSNSLQLQENKQTPASVQLRDKVYGLLSNLSMHPGAREQLAQCTKLVELVIKAGVLCKVEASTNKSQGNRAAALGLLCNLSLNTTVQRLLACTPGCVDSLLAQVCCATGRHAWSSKQPSAKAVRANPQLPPRKQPKHQPDQQYQQQQQSPVEDEQLRQQRAACLLSRTAKQPAGIQELLKLGAAGRLLEALSNTLQRQAQDQHAQVQDEMKQAGQHTVELPKRDAPCNGTTWCDAVMRTIALLTAQPNFCSSCTSEEAVVAIRVCMALLGTVREEAVLGNAALCLSHFAAEPQWHQQLRKVDAVKVLVDTAYKGRGSPSSKNAAIALAKLAKDEHMLTRLRELHGLEIIYQYVRV